MGTAAAKKYPPDIETALVLVDQMPLRPHSSYTVGTAYISGGSWTRPTCSGMKRSPRGQASGAGMARHGACGRQQPRYTLDSVHDLARLMRVPGTSNRKVRQDHRPVTILEPRDGTVIRYALAELSAHVCSMAAQPANNEKAAPVGDLRVDAAAEPPLVTSSTVC